MKKKPDPAAKPLRSVSDLRRFFHRNETPIYFISATNFNLLGADEWVKGLKFISYIDCFDGLHPNVFTPKEQLPHPEFESIEDINNYLLGHKEVIDHIESRSGAHGAGKALFLMFDEQTERMAKSLGLEVAFPTAKMRSDLDNKVNTNRVAEKAGVPCVPYVLAPARSYDELRKVAGHLGEHLVVQTPFGDSGHTTFFISSREEFDEVADEIVGEPELKIMRRIRCRGSAIEACVTRHGTIVAPLMTELVGFPELTPYKGGWCGNEIYADAFTSTLRQKARRYTRLFGDQLRKEGYRGYFELDFLIDVDSKQIYLGELNPRVTGASTITNHAVFALADAPLFLFHILEWMDRDYKFSINAINSRWARPENIDSWSQLVIKHIDDDLRIVQSAPRSGIWRMQPGGRIEFNRMDTHRRAVESEQEAFFLRISAKGDYLYEGADMGILVTRGRLMTDAFELTDRARQWISAIRGQFQSHPAQPQAAAAAVGQIAGFKMM